MSLSDVVEGILPSVVALGHRTEFTTNNFPPNFPTILGTGFVVDDRGLIVTNQHVVDALDKRPHSERFAAFFRQVRMPNGTIQIGVLFRRLVGYYTLGSFNPSGRYYGDTKPDIAFLSVDVRGLDTLSIDHAENTIRMGVDVVSVGFPSGRDRLSPHGGPVPSQLQPFARRGIVSSVLPCPCFNPHGFTIDILSEGGCSGSPICKTDDGKVIGVLYGGWPGEPITLCVPGHILATGLTSVLSQWKPDPTIPTMEELTKRDLNAVESPLEWTHLGQITR